MGLETIDAAVIVAYLLGITAVGLWSSRRQTATSDGYFLAGRSLDAASSRVQQVSCAPDSERHAPLESRSSGRFMMGPRPVAHEGIGRAPGDRTSKEPPVSSRLHRREDHPRTQHGQPAMLATRAASVRDRLRHHTMRVSTNTTAQNSPEGIHPNMTLPVRSAPSAKASAGGLSIPCQAP